MYLLKCYRIFAYIINIMWYLYIYIYIYIYNIISPFNCSDRVLDNILRIQRIWACTQAATVGLEDLNRCLRAGTTMPGQAKVRNNPLALTKRVANQLLMWGVPLLMSLAKRENNFKSIMLSVVCFWKIESHMHRLINLIFQIHQLRLHICDFAAESATRAQQFHAWTSRIVHCWYHMKVIGTNNM